jgi:hypothetical protein
MNAFILASKKKLRFASTRGPLAVEDLWDLDLPALDTIAVALDDKVQKSGRKSFIGRRDKSTADEELRFEIVKLVIDTKIEEAEKAKTAASRRSEREFLKGLIEQKRTKELESLDLPEIQKRLDALDAEEDGAGA